ncbi:energy-coupling factor ABC transporter ATP-binding protein [Sediminibacillus dalangtanensis]|uniref:Energy-coupling factor transporter ATP-binding protein EcfA2 n=1 Tax=Sediminibacillus dalangtanensis TaxID=2729421 RepID=A0ABX7VM90_9BACI|nr:energy-coupling factor ABC transporter ATP-binding protein [Sediminibacillus dalangtanensis]QTM97909.1 energy-coupling factor ABC transporter ATP-binding protein [Sediminibacillus dalangtanensis]
MEISFKQVSYTYQPNTPFEHRAINDLSMDVSSGSFTAIIGHTGSGKSTLIQHLNGLLKPSSGEVTIGPYRLHAEAKLKGIKELRSKVGIVFQYPEHQLFEETVFKDIAFGPLNFGVDRQEVEKRVGQAMQAVQLPEELLARSPFELSGGQMRRVAIAGVLAVQPELLVLDEPTAGLDPKGQKEMMDMFHHLHKQKGLTTILVTHSMEDALAYADHVIILNKGEKYLEGKPAEVFTRQQDLQKVQLDVPEVIQFIMKVKDRFQVDLSYHGQTIKELAEELALIVKGASRYE